MTTKVKHECDECGMTMIRGTEQDRMFCSNCSDTRPVSVLTQLTEYTVIIEVTGQIDHNGRTHTVNGVTGRTAIANTESEAKRKAVTDFKANPDYNTDISVNKDKFPDGRYLDDWGYQASSARAIDAVPSDEYRTMSVRWRDRGLVYCEWESSSF